MAADYKPVRHKTAHRRLEGSIDPADVAEVREQQSSAEPLLAAVGRLTMIWNNIDINLRWRLGSRPGATPEEWLRGSTSALIERMKAVTVPNELAEAWNHLLTYFNQLREYRNHFIHGISTTYVSDEHSLMEAYLIKTFHSPKYEEVIETIYKEDLDELTAHLSVFGGFAMRVLNYLIGISIEIPNVPPLPPPYRRQMRDPDEMKRDWAMIAGEAQQG